MTQEKETLAKDILDEVAKDGKNISFLTKAVGISLIIFTVIVSLGTVIAISTPAKKYIESKIEKCVK